MTSDLMVNEGVVKRNRVSAPLALSLVSWAAVLVVAESPQTVL